MAQGSDLANNKRTSKNSWNAFTKNMFMFRFQIYRWSICLFWYLFLFLSNKGSENPYWDCIRFILRQKVGCVVAAHGTNMSAWRQQHWGEFTWHRCDDNRCFTPCVCTITHIYLRRARWPSNQVSDNIKHRSQTCLVWAAPDLTLCNSAPMRALCCFQK